MQLERELPLRAYFCGQKNDVEKAHAPSPVSVNDTADEIRNSQIGQLLFYEET